MQNGARATFAHPIRLLLVALLVSCSGSASVKAPAALRDAGAPRGPDAAAARPKELRALPVTRFGVGLDGVAGIAVEAKHLHVYGTDLADRSFKRISVTPTGGVKVMVLKTTAQLDHPFDIQRCGGKHQVTKSISGPGNKWNLLTLDLLLKGHATVPLPRFGTKGFVWPKLICEGGTAWLLWSTAKQTRVQVGRGGKWVATHQLKAPEKGWPRFIVPVLYPVAWKGRLHLLRRSTRGLEAILVERKGEIRRSTLTGKETQFAALARVGRRFLAVWLERTKLRTTFRGRAGRIKGRWLVVSFARLGPTEVFLEQTPSSNVSLHLWADAKGRVVLGRTDRVPRRRMRGGFTYEISSHITSYDVAHTRLGPWIPLGRTPIYGGVWIANTLHVVMNGGTSPVRAHVRRFRFAP